VTSWDELADEIAALEGRISDLIFDNVRSQLRGDDLAAKERERTLSRVRRSLQKAQHLLRSGDESD